MILVEIVRIFAIAFIIGMVLGYCVGRTEEKKTVKETT